MNCKAVIFDLDGTLLDTLTDIADAANQALTQEGFPVHPQEAYKTFVGDGSRILMTRALPEDQRTPETIETCLQRFIEIYNRNWDRATVPYDGILDLVAVLQNKGYKLSVVTNKPHRFTGVMMDHYFMHIPFDPILGQRDDVPKKPHPQQALTAAQQMGVSPKKCIFLGDSAVDMETARRAGMQPVGAGWGFRSAKELTDAGALVVLDHPKRLTV